MSFHLSQILGQLKIPRHLVVKSSPRLAKDVGHGRPILGAQGGSAHSPRTVLRDWAITYSSLYNPPLAAAQRHWGILKYLSYFDMGRPDPLYVSPIGESLRYTMRRAASEELGEAFSIALAKRWFAAEVMFRFPSASPHPRVHVVNLENDLPDALVDDWKLGLATAGRRPDFLLTCELSPGSGSLAVGTLESKGTGNHGNVVRQLRSAAGQVQAVEIGGTVPTGYIVDTVSGSGPVHCYALELGDGPTQLTKRAKLHPNISGNDLEEGILADLAAALLAFVGDAQGRDRWLSPKRRASSRVQDVIRGPDRPLSASSTLPYSDGNVRITTGLDRDIRELLDEDEIGEVVSRLSAKKGPPLDEPTGEPEETGFYLDLEADPRET